MRQHNMKLDSWMNWFENFHSPVLVTLGKTENVDAGTQTCSNSYRLYDTDFCPNLALIFMLLLDGN